MDNIHECYQTNKIIKPVDMHVHQYLNSNHIRLSCLKIAHG